MTMDKNKLIWLAGGTIVVLLLVIAFLLGKLSNRQQLVEEAPTRTERQVSKTTGEKSSQSKSQKVDKTDSWREVSLRDEQTGAELFTTKLPEGWQAQLSTSWTMVDLNYPLLAAISIVNPEGDATLSIYSNIAYAEVFGVTTGKQSERMDRNFNITYRDYRPADEALDMVLDEIGLTQLQEVQEVPVSNAQEEAVIDVAEKQGKKLYQELVKTGNIHSVDKEHLSSVAEKVYRNEEGYLQAATATLGSTIEIPNVMETTNWELPYVVFYGGKDKQAFDRDLATAWQIVGESNFTQGFYAINEEYSQMISQSGDKIDRAMMIDSLTNGNAAEHVSERAQTLSDYNRQLLSQFSQE
ncbi:hypothetical protein IJJ27_01880 [bacterium]|nr:hypothetical protein [bacterium]